MNSINESQPIVPPDAEAKDVIPGDSPRLHEQLRSLQHELTAIHKELYSMLTTVWLYILLLYSQSLKSEKATWANAFLFLALLGMTVYCTYRNFKLHKWYRRTRDLSKETSNQL